jgi:hypothetical protein
LLVTGLPRSGTSWVGKMLELSGEVTYVNEPLNPEHPPGHSPGVLAVEPDRQFQYICADNDAEWLPAFRKTVALRYGVAAELRRNRGAYDLARLAKYSSSFSLGRVRGRRALVDDPYALFSTRWFAERLGARSLVLVRDPVSLVGSWLRFGWTQYVEELLQQPLLIRDLVEEPQRLTDLVGSTDDVAKISELWRVAYAAIDRVRDVPGIHVRCYEDLVKDPQAGFHDLYDVLGLTWTAATSDGIAKATTKTGDSGGGFKWTLRGGLSRTAFRPMDAATALSSHVGRISDADAQRVRDITGDVARRFYQPAAD